MYKLVKNRESQVFEIIENDTNLVIIRNEDREKLYSTFRNLQKGSGFQGFTPPFITNL